MSTSWIDQASTSARGVRRVRRGAWHAGGLVAVAALFVPTLVAPAAARAEGPVDFGLAELHRVIEERGLNPRSFQVAVEYSLVLPADGFQIQGQIIRGGSRRA